MATLLGSTLAYATQPYESYEEAVASDQPVAQFRFNDVAGSTTIADSVGSYTATNHEVTFSSPGPFNGSRYGFFGGVPKGPYGELPSSPLAGDSEFTIEGWVKWLGNAGSEPILYFGSSSSNYMLLTPFSNTSPARLMFEIHTSEGKGAQVKGSGWLPEAWAYVAVTETSSGTLTLYENGSQVGQTTGAAVSPASLGATADDWLGRSQLSPNTIFVGDMSNVAFYAKALSSERVLAHYDAAEYPVNTSAPTEPVNPNETLLSGI